MKPAAIASQFDMLHGGSRLSVFLYETDHSPVDIMDPAYFLPVAGRLRRNDVVVVCADAGQTPKWLLMMVRKIEAHKVTLEDLGVFGGLRQLCPTPEHGESE